ncbi:MULTISPECIES: hypothetical protein [unclassified Cyanobium]|nr:MULTISPECIES: hypothetical protein [unclassified Cyanobium]
MAKLAIRQRSIQGVVEPNLAALGPVRTEKLEHEAPPSFTPKR